MVLIDLSESPIISALLAVLRDEKTPPSVFRQFLRKLGMFLAYEYGKTLPTVKKSVKSPLGTAEYSAPGVRPVVIGVLRAALPMVEGVMEVLPEAELGLISASRTKMLDDKGEDFEISMDYVKIPPIEGKYILLTDPMLASASTLLGIIERLIAQRPTSIAILCVIASEYGINRILKKYKDVDIYTAAVDKELNDKGYIVPGLGDAGDRAFNTSFD